MEEDVYARNCCVISVRRRAGPSRLTLEYRPGYPSVAFALYINADGSDARRLKSNGGPTTTVDSGIGQIQQKRRDAEMLLDVMMINGGGR